MKKSVGGKRAAGGKEGGFDMAAVIDRMQQQLAVMERKLDTLITRSSERPFGLSNTPRIGQGFERPAPPVSFSAQRTMPAVNNNFNHRTMYKAVCADCKSQCEVPFKPSGERPVYCKECFAKRKNVRNNNTPHAHGGSRQVQAVAVVQESRIVKSVKVAKKKAQKRPKKK